MIAIEMLKCKLLGVDKMVCEPIHLGSAYLLLFMIDDTKSEYRKFVLYGVKMRNSRPMLKFRSIENKEEKVEVWIGCLGTWSVRFAGKDVDRAYNHYSGLLKRGNGLEDLMGSGFF